jgi:hypothetical protein
VSETLVVDDTEVDVGGELLAGDAAVHGFVAVVVVPSGEKLRRRQRGPTCQVIREMLRSPARQRTPQADQRPRICD